MSTKSKQRESSKQKKSKQKIKEDQPVSLTADDVVLQEEAEVEDVEEDIIKSIDILKDHGIPPSKIKSLKDAGIHTLGGLSMCTKRFLTSLPNFTEQSVEKVLKIACEYVPMYTFTNGLEFSKLREGIAKITTGSCALDKLLDGGIETGSITEMFGEFGTGKTQLCHQLCVTCQLPHEKGGGAGRALVIDTESSFRPERCREIAERYLLDADVVLSNITYARALNIDHQLSLVNSAAELFAKERYALIIVDSATALYRVNFSGRGELSERQQHLSKFLHKLFSIAMEFGVAAVITNQVVDDPGSMYGNSKVPIGGNIIAHASTTRLSFRKGKQGSRVCKIYDSPHLPTAEATFMINPFGIGDFEV